MLLAADQRFLAQFWVVSDGLGLVGFAYGMGQSLDSCFGCYQLRSPHLYGISKTVQSNAPNGPSASELLAP